MIRLLKLAPSAIFVLPLAACGTLQEVAAPKDEGTAAVVRTVRNVTDVPGLVGANGKTPKDQNAIDNTITGSCSVGALTPDECKRHGLETAQ